MSDNSFFIAGSAHVDLLANVTGHSETIDKPGELRIEFGGTAYNMVMNIKSIEMSVREKTGNNDYKLGCRFMSAFRDSPLSEAIISSLEEIDVDVVPSLHKEFPESGFSAHIHQGELIAAVSSTPIEKADFDETEIERVMEGCIATIVDCNLSVNTLNSIIRISNEMDIPVFVAAVSESKALKLDEIKGNVDFIFLNHAELDYLRKNRYPRKKTYTEMQEVLGAKLIITRGAEGVAYVNDKGKPTMISPPKLSRSKGMNHFLGAGDALMAGVTKRIAVDGMSPGGAITDAISDVAKIVATLSCNLVGENAIEKRMRDIEQKANTDHMTGALNRKSTEAALRKEIGRVEAEHLSCVSLIFGDIDKFKSINDNFGHGVGDEMIKFLADTMKEVVREVDYVGRWGGEEFLCLLPGTHLDAAARVAERIRERVSKDYIEQIQRHLTISLGVAEFKVGESMLQFVERADGALYEAKEGGRNQVQISSGNGSFERFNF